MGILTAIPAFTDNYIWCYQNADAENIVIDPGDATPILHAIASGMRVKAIFVTHHHPDHIDGIAGLLQHIRVPCYGPIDARIENISHHVRHGDTITLHGFKPFTVWHVPGHTLSHIAYVNEQVLFCGDTLFSLGCGRLFEGSPTQMLASLDLLANLPDSTLVCCTHEYTQSNARFAITAEPHNPARDQYCLEFMTKRTQGEPSLPSTIGLEKACNPFLRVDAVESLSGLYNHLGYKPQTRLERFTALRCWKDQF
jgi:hydroxyacylglutathione hydrolase